MIAAERHRRILEHLRLEGVVRVNALAAALDVASETIRRDLEKLESDGHLLRQHGGATLPEFNSVDFPFIERRSRLVEEKTRIAREAVGRVQEGETILIDGSTTLLQFARLLRDVPLTVITNSHHAVAELAAKQKIVTILLGGTLHRESLCFVGPATQKQLEGYHVDKVFMSCRSVGLKQGAADANEIHAGVKELMLRQAGKRYLLVDHEKFDRQSLVRIAGLREFDEVITDAGLPAALRRQYKPACRELTIV